MKVNNFPAQQRYETYSCKYLLHLLSSCPEWTEAIKGLEDRITRIEQAASEAALRILGVERYDQPDRPINIIVSTSYHGQVYFSVSSDWSHFTPTGLVYANHNLPDLIEFLPAPLTSEFTTIYADASTTFEQGMTELLHFLSQGKEVNFLADHYIYLLPNIKILFDGGDDTFKRRPRKIKNIDPPGKTLRKALLLLASAKAVIE